MISTLLQLKRTPTITIRASRASSSPHGNHGNKSLPNSTDFHIKSRTMVRLLKILLQLSPDRASLTPFQLTLDLRWTLQWRNTLYRSGTVVRTRSNAPPIYRSSSKIKTSHTMGISNAWTQPFRVVTVEITYKTEDRLLPIALQRQQNTLSSVLGLRWTTNK